MKNKSNFYFLKILSIVLLILFNLEELVSQNNKITINLKNNCYKGVALYSLRGYEKNLVDTIAIEGNQIFSLNIPIGLKTGIYKIVFDDNRAFDVIYEEKPFEIIINDCSDLINGVIFNGSRSNTVLYAYRKYKDKKAKDIFTDRLQKKFIEVTTDSNKQEMLDSLNVRIELHTDSIYMYGDSLVEKHKGTFLSKVLKAMMVPKYSYFKRVGRISTDFSSEKDFLSVHFFDNIDFSDTNLINSEIFFIAAKTYVEKISGRSVEELKKTCDFILNKAVNNKKVYLHLIDILMALFEYSEFDDVFVYLVEHYYNNEFCDNNAVVADINKRVEAIKNMKVGKKVPNFEAVNLNGEKIGLYSIKAKNILILFWSPSCEHCEELIPKLIEKYSFYKKLGLEIVSLCVDDEKEEWIDASMKFKIPWINLNDFSGGKGIIPQSYNVWHTPTMYLVDKNYIIKAIPKNYEDVEYWLNTLYR